MKYHSSQCSSEPPSTIITVDYVGNNNVIEAAGILGVTRMVLVTSIGCGSSKEATPPSGEFIRVIYD